MKAPLWNLSLRTEVAQGASILERFNAFTPVKKQLALKEKVATDVDFFTVGGKAG